MKKSLLSIVIAGVALLAIVPVLSAALIHVAPDAYTQIKNGVAGVPGLAAWITGFAVLEIAYFFVSLRD